MKEAAGVGYKNGIWFNLFYYISQIVRPSYVCHKRIAHVRRVNEDQYGVKGEKLAE